MDVEFTLKRVVIVIFLNFVVLLGSVHAQSNIVVEIKPTKENVALSKYETFVLNALFEDIGLTFDTQKKENAVPDPVSDDVSPLPPPNIDPPPQPEPSPEPPTPAPEPEPTPKPKTKDDSWGFNKMRDKFQNDYSAALKNWNDNYQQVLARWREERKSYLQNEPKYLEATVDFSQLLSESPENFLQQNAPQRNLNVSLPSDAFHVIPHALNIKIKNQMFRGTCAAFAGIRAVETVLQQDTNLQKYQLDLSEQHFYWISKPRCMKTPCIAGRDPEGSIFDTGFKMSQSGKAEFTALRQEKYCPYETRVKRTNLSYTPLESCSSAGQFKVNKYHSGMRIDDIVTELSKNRPIAAGFKLTKSFFNTKGLVKARDPVNAANALGKHAGGHAVLLVGYIKLPEKYWTNEGKYCAIAANSWGAGYGKGGFACLSETWMKENRFAITRNSQRSILTSVESVVLIDNSKT